MAASGPLYLGFDLSTQQLKGLIVDSDLKLKHEAKVDFDADLGKYGIHKGVLTNPTENEIFAPVAMWLEAVDLVLHRLKEDGLDFSRIKGTSGAGMQHGVVFWSKDAGEILKGLDGAKTLVEQFEPGAKGERKGAFSHPHSPNWQDASTQKQCEAFDAALGGPEALAELTGSKAHHRFSGPQILRWHQKYPEEWKNTSRISLVSSFLASVFLGSIAPIDISDVCGMNLRQIKGGAWDETLLKLTAGKEDVEDLRTKLGPVPEDGGGSIGQISPYFVKRYGFPKDCAIIPFTGDNPSTILALPLRASDAMVSLGTSTTFLMSTPAYKPDPAYHFMNHPTTPGLYMFMLCYKNGGLAREQIRDQINEKTTDAKPNSWDKFDSLAISTAPLAQSKPLDPMRMGLYFPRPEIVPNVSAGRRRFEYSSSTDHLTEIGDSISLVDPRVIVESQMLSLRLRSTALVEPHIIDGKTLPAQPRRVYLVGGGSANAAIAQICGEVLGGVEGVFKLDIGGNACALGSAYKAVWSCERKEGEKFEELIGSRWDESTFVKKVADGYKEGVFERYGEALKVFERMEQKVLDEAKGKELNKGGSILQDGSSNVKGAINP